jgi:hypothetical protein
MKDFLLYLKFTVIIVAYFFSLASNAKATMSGFAFSEHLAAAKSIKISQEQLCKNQQGCLLILSNGLMLSYAQIMPLGDLFGLVGKPISMAKTYEQKKLRFIDAFNSFASNKDMVDEVNQLIAVIEDEMATVEQGLENGENAEVIFQRIGNEIGRKVNCITGGGCQSSSWWLFPGRYLKLAKENYDHFSPNAQNVYLIGHQVAIEQAVKAHESQSLSELSKAYAMNAFASHFLSDSFASGHMRAPRFELQNKVTPAVLGALLANYMHNEDNKNGLHVYNLRGDEWIAYGDFSYFNPNNLANSRLLEKVLQLSVDEITSAYHWGISNNDSKIMTLIPRVKEKGNTANIDISALFYWDKKHKKLYRRNDVTDLFDKHWTSNWWGWSTFFALKRHYGMTSQMASMIQDEIFLELQ